MAIEWKAEAQPREKIYFFVFLLLIIVMFGRVVWGPRLQQTKGDAKELETVVLQVKTIKQRLEEVRKLQATGTAVTGVQPAGAAAAEATDDRFAPYLRGQIKSRQQVMGEIVKQITGPQSLKGLALAGLAFGTEADAGTYLTIPMELNLEGPFAALVRYLATVEALPIMLTVDNVELAAPAAKGGLLQAKLFATVYVVKSAAAITVGGTVAPPAHASPTK